MLTALVLGIGLVGAVRLLDTDAVLAALARADRYVLTMGAVFYLASWPVRGYRYRDILRSMGHGGRTAMLTGATFVSQAANLLVPARAGDGVRAYIVNDRLGVPYNDGVASLLVERVLDLITVTAIAVFAISVLVVFGESVDTTLVDDRILLAASAVAVGGVFLAVAVVGVARWGGSLWSRFGRLPEGPREWIVRVFVATRRGLTNGQTAPAVFGASGVIWLLDVVVGLFVLLAVLEPGRIGGVISLTLAVALAVCVGNLAKTVPLTHGGIGMYEAAFLGIIVGTTPIAPELALAIAILDHGIKNAVTLAGGLTAAFVLFGRIPGLEDDVESSYF